jgi:hypothetical protein
MQDLVPVIDSGPHLVGSHVDDSVRYGSDYLAIAQIELGFDRA